MKLAVIGGGITGIVTSILAKEKGYQVKLYEASGSIGGVIRDIVVNESWYFNNTQYLNVDGVCYQTIQRCITNKFEVFEHNYASITERKNESIFFEDFAQPILASSIPDYSNFFSVPSDISNRLKKYDNESEFLVQFAKRFGDLEELHSSNLLMMQLSRVFYLNHSEEIKNLKSFNSAADTMLGLPRTLVNPKVIKVKAALPINGYNEMLGKLYHYLLEIGVEIELNSPIKVNYKNKIELYSRSKLLNFDLAIWCTNPTSLLSKILKYKMSSPPIKMYCAVGNCKFIQELKPIYIQVFSLRTSIIRFFLYNDKNETKITIEGFNEYDSEVEVTIVINDYLKRHYNTHLVSDLFFSKQNRYTLISKNDYEVMSIYKASLVHKRVISGSWELYGRDQKVNSITLELGEIS